MYYFVAIYLIASNAISLKQIAAYFGSLHCPIGPGGIQ
jgi:hypothetical protein